MVSRYVYSYIYVYIYKIPFSYIFRALIFPHRSTPPVSETFYLFFSWLLLTTYCFSKKQAIKCVWCSSPGFHISGTFSQHHAAISPCLPCLVPLLSSALWLSKVTAHLPSTITSSPLLFTFLRTISVLQCQTLPITSMNSGLDFHF